MAKALKRRAARAVAQETSKNGYWIQHAEFCEDDIDWFNAAERLTLWNVTAPPGFYAKLSKLWWLDIRGGSGVDLALLEGVSGLRYLSINQIRGMSDLSAASHLHSIECLQFYGMLQVTTLPSFSEMTRLRRVDLGQLRGIDSISGVLDAPRLQSLQLLRKINLTSTDVDRINNHPSLKEFSWFAEDVPNKVWCPIVERIKLPAASELSGPAWFKANSGVP
ncbi:MAG: hypothetical protein JWM57_3608 [Phycisphaerales bacterium]|nr:hypothetical protein [Phycisphaerales bacterium]